MLEKVENYVDSSFILRNLQIVFSYFSPLTLIVTTLITLWIVNYNRKRARMVNLIEKIPGPPALPFIGEWRLIIITASRYLTANLQQKFLLQETQSRLTSSTMVKHFGSFNTQKNRKKIAEKFRFHSKTCLFIKNSLGVPVHILNKWWWRAFA